MSFAGSLICCGIGGLFLKYGGQEAEKEEIVPTGFHELTAGFVESKKKTARQRLESVKNHFIRDFTTGEIYNFPVKVCFLLDVSYKNEFSINTNNQ